MERIDRIEQALAELIAQDEKRFARTEQGFAEIRALFAESDKGFAQTKALFAKTEAQVERTSKELSNVGHNNGDYAEDYFYNSLSGTMVFAGIKYDTISKNIHIKRHRLEDEFDLVMYNGNSIALIECKYKAHEKDLKKLVEKKVNNFRELNTDYANYTIYCGLASFSFYPELEQQALDLGVAVLKQKGDLMEVNASTIRAY